MSNFNQVILMGFLTRDPDLAYTSSQSAVCNFCIAVNDFIGQKKDVFFGECTAFGKTAENIYKYLKKGSGAQIIGRLTTAEWKDKDTKKKRTQTKIIVGRAIFLGSSPLQPE